MNNTVLTPDRALQRAFEITCAAYEEALRQHGMLPSTVKLISSYAERNLAALNGEDAPQTPPADL